MPCACGELPTQNSSTPRNSRPLHSVGGVSNGRVQFGTPPPIATDVSSPVDRDSMGSPGTPASMGSGTGRRRAATVSGPRPVLMTKISTAELTRQLEGLEHQEDTSPVAPL